MKTEKTATLTGEALTLDLDYCIRMLGKAKEGILTTTTPEGEEIVSGVDIAFMNYQSEEYINMIISPKKIHDFYNLKNNLKVHENYQLAVAFESADIIRKSWMTNERILMRGNKYQFLKSNKILLIIKQFKHTNVFRKEKLFVI